VIALNMWDAAVDKNIQIDAAELEQILGVPVIPTVAISGEGISAVVSKLKDITPSNVDDIVERMGGV